MILYTRDIKVNAILKEHNCYPQIDTPENRYAMAEYLWWPHSTSLTDEKLVKMFHRAVYKACLGEITFCSVIGDSVKSNYMRQAEMYYRAGQDRDMDMTLFAVAERKAMNLLRL